MDVKGVSLDEVKKLNDLVAINRLLQETITRERSIDADLETLLGQRQVLEGKLLDVHKSSEVLKLVRADSEQMTSSITSTCTLAERVSSKVRELDLAQTRVRDTVGRITAVVDRTTAVDGVKSALETEQYEEAAQYIETFLKLDVPVKSQQLADTDENKEQNVEVTQAEEQRATVLAAKKSLEEVIRSKFAAAAEAKDHKAVLRYVKLYAPCGLKAEGEKSFCAYLRSVIGSRANEEYQEMTSAIDSGSPADFVGVLTGLFKDVAEAVEGNHEVLVDSFGAGSILAAVQELHKECDVRGTRIIQRFVNHNSLTSIVKEIAKGSPETAPDPKEVEGYLEELLMICQRSEEYSAFMLSKMKESQDSPLSPTIGNTFKTGKFNIAVQELIGYYISMEEFYMSENVKMAIRIDEIPPDALTSSMVDDVFYILQKCARRTLSTASIQSVCAGLNNINNLLGAEYRDALHHRLRGGPSKLAQSAPSPANPASTSISYRPPGIDHAVAINSADLSAEYVTKLKRELEGYLGEVFQVGGPERERFKACLNDLGETSTTFRHLANQALEQLCGALSPRLRSVIDTVATANYELSEAEYAAGDVEDSWVHSLIRAVEASAQWLQPYLSAANYDQLLQLVMDHIVQRLEVLVMQKRFNQLGGLHLDREMRALVTHFSSVTSRTIRDKFARLTQMATILNLESVQEMLDYWGDNSTGMTWRLTPAEVRRVLGLRSDFKPETIAQLKL